MKKILLNDVLAVTGGRLLGEYNNKNCEIIGIASNTNDLEGNEMFVAYHGKNCDGHDFVDKALDLGCNGCLIEKELENYRNDKFYVLVDDSLEALWKIVELRRAYIPAKIVCVTGSVGKTTTTRMIASVLRQKYISTCNLGVEGIPDWVFDKHTLKGKKAGKTSLDMIQSEQDALQPHQIGMFDDGDWYQWSRICNISDADKMKWPEFARTRKRYK